QGCRPVVLEHRGDEPARDAGVGRIHGRAASLVEAVLEIGLHPGTGPRARLEPARGAEVDRVHGAISPDLPVGLAVAVVEAASAVDMRAARHHVEALGSASGRNPRRGTVLPVAVARVDVERVDLAAAGRHGFARRARGRVLAPRTARTLVGEVVAVSRLVVDHRDGARRARAEGVLRGRRRDAPGIRYPDILRRCVRGAPHLVEVSGVRAIEGPYRAMRGDAWCTAGAIDVARPAGVSG